MENVPKIYVLRALSLNSEVRHLSEIFRYIDNLDTCPKVLGRI
jgi:hypothetical protein